jgi:hypothetical protein
MNYSTVFRKYVLCTYLGTFLLHWLLRENLLLLGFLNLEKMYIYAQRGLLYNILRVSKARLTIKKYCFEWYQISLSDYIINDNKFITNLCQILWCWDAAVHKIHLFFWSLDLQKNIFMTDFHHTEHILLIDGRNLFYIFPSFEMNTQDSLTPWKWRFCPWERCWCLKWSLKELSSEMDLA